MGFLASHPSLHVFEVELSHLKVGLSMGAPAGYLDSYPQVFSGKNSYLDL
jgi:hypothetical protein